MGYRTVVVLANDDQHNWEQDPELGKKIAIKTGGKKVNPFDLIDPKKSEQAMADLFKSHTAAMNQPVTGAVPQDNRDYQMISPTVATFSVGTSTLTPRILLGSAITLVAGVFITLGGKKGEDKEEAAKD